MKNILRTVACAMLLPVVVYLPGQALAWKELDVSRPWCAGHGGRAEVVLSDHTRADCVTDGPPWLAGGVVWEMDRARHWYEGLGQALHYARLTGKAPGLALIVERPADRRKVERARETIRAWGLPVVVEELRIPAVSAAAGAVVP